MSNPSGIPNDTTTQLNSGSGGDKMDESLVTQTDGVTTAKRPRVVVGGDDGSLLSLNVGPDITEAHVTDRTVIDVLVEISREAKRQTSLLRLILGKMGGGSVDLSVIDEFSTDGD